MTEPRSKIPLGPSGQTAAARVRELREAKGLGFNELSRQLEDLGRSIPALGLRRIENLERRVDSDDLVALAVVLGVSPVSFLLPNRSHGTVEMTGVGEIPADTAWSWVRAEHPLQAEDDPDDPEGVVWADWIERARPSYLIESFETPESRRRLADRVQGLPDWIVERAADGTVTKLSMTGAAVAPTVLWPREDTSNGR